MQVFLDDVCVKCLRLHLVHMRKTLSLFALFFVSPHCFGQTTFTTDFYIRLFTSNGRMIDEKDFASGAVRIYVRQRNAIPILFTGTERKVGITTHSFYLRLETVATVSPFVIVTETDTLLTYLPSNGVDVIVDSLVIRNGICNDSPALLSGGSKFTCKPKQKDCALDLEGCAWYKAFFDYYYLRTNTCRLNLQYPGHANFNADKASTIEQMRRLKWCSGIVTK